MKKRKGYVFGAAMAGMAFGGVPSMVNRADAAAITAADFTFETSGVALNAVNVTAPVAGPFMAEAGVGTAAGSHAAALTVYSSPTGDGSARSFSSNNWGTGDYYQFSVPTISLTGIQVSFDEIGSATGPSQFALVYSTDGTTFSTAGTYTVAAAPAWSSGASQAAFNHAFDLSGVSGLANDPTAIFRIVDVGTAAINGASTGVSSGGTDRVDNFIVSGTAIPEPASVSLLTAAAAALLLRRRRD